MKRITNSSYVAALFIRGFLESIDENGTPLRECQDNGRATVEEFELNMSTPYISKLSKLLGTENVIDKHKEGKHYVATPGDNFDAMMEFLEKNPDWGNTDGKDEQVKAKARVVNAGYYLRASSDERLSPEAWKILYQALMDGEVEMMFYPADKKVGYVKRVNGKLKLKRPQTWKEVIENE